MIWSRLPRYLGACFQIPSHALCPVRSKVPGSLSVFGATAAAAPYYPSFPFSPEKRAQVGEQWELMQSLRPKGLFGGWIPSSRLLIRHGLLPPHPKPSGIVSWRLNSVFCRARIYQ